MSIKRPLEVTCNLCRARQTVTVWETVNVMPDPEMKDEVIEQHVYEPSQLLGDSNDMVAA